MKKKGGIRDGREKIEGRSNRNRKCCWYCHPLPERQEEHGTVGSWGHKETAPQNIGMDSRLLDLDEPNGIIITGDEEEIFALKLDCAVMAINIRNPMTKVNGEWYKKFLQLILSIRSVRQDNLSKDIVKAFIGYR